MGVGCVHSGLFLVHTLEWEHGAGIWPPTNSFRRHHRICRGVRSLWLRAEHGQLDRWEGSVFFRSTISCADSGIQLFKVLVTGVFKHWYLL